LNGTYNVASFGRAIGAQGGGNTNAITIENVTFNLVGEIGVGALDDVVGCISFPSPDAQVTFDFNATGPDGIAFPAKEFNYRDSSISGITNATKFINNDLQNVQEPLSTPSVFVQFRGDSYPQNLKNTDSVHIAEVEVGNYPSVPREWLFPVI
jgi:hypothetical protein